MFRIAMVIVFMVNLLSCIGNMQSQGEVAVYLTDSFRDDFAQVWLILKKVEIRTEVSSEFTTLYNNPNGLLIDARTLRDNSGEKFAFLTRASLPVADYDAVRVTLGTSAVVIPAGDPVGQVLAVSNPVVTHEFEESLAVLGNALVVDFDLANFVADTSTLTISIKRGDPTTLGQRNRHRLSIFSGTVSNLADGSFILVSEHPPLTVRFDESTHIVDEATGREALIGVNGVSVRVFGTFLVPEGYLAAAKIVVEDGENSEFYVRGTNENLNFGARTLTLVDIRNPEGFVPRKSVVNVHWTSDTVFRRSGVVVDEMALNTYTLSEVKGIYDEETNTIDATGFSFEDEEGGDVSQKATGVKSNLNLVSNTMVLLNPNQVQGFGALATLKVSFSEDTLFILNGVATDKLALVNASTLRVKGIYNLGTNTLTASRIKIVTSN